MFRAPGESATRSSSCTKVTFSRKAQSTNWTGIPTRSCSSSCSPRRLSMLSKSKIAAGAFLIGGLLLFALGLFLIGDRRMLFSRSVNYYAEFAQVSALETGGKVRVGGMDAGEILEIRVPQG